jgi:outer membrane protein assembly factor BamB
MKSHDPRQLGMDRRLFLAAAALPLACPWDRLFAQQGSVPQELDLTHKSLPRDPARTVRDYCLETELSPKTAVIICPASAEYERIARGLSENLAPECGGRLEVRPIGPEEERWPSSPCHLILIGNAINHPLIFRLYVNHYTLVDEYFPGPGEEFLQTVHNPFGDSRNVVILGASDVQGALSAARALVTLVRNKGPKLGFTLHSRSSRLPAQSPRAEDFLYGLEKRKEQIEVGDIPWVAMDYGMLYHLTGDQRWGELFRDLHLYAGRVARERGTWPRTVFDNDFYLYRLLTVWDLIEESPIFSDEDRRAITQLCLEVTRYVAGMSYLQVFFTGGLALGNNHQTFPAISIFMAHRYFSKYYGWQEFVLLQPAVEAIFALHNTSWRPNDNDEGVGVRTHRHLINYSLIQGDSTYFQSGRERLLADWIIMVTDNRADTLAFGDAGEYDGVYQGGRGKIQDQYCLALLSLAAWYYRDGRYAWARDWFRKGLDWRDRLDFGQLLCRKYGWQERYGITEWEFYLGWLYRGGIQPSQPNHLLGVAVARYDEAGRVMAGVEDIPREEAFDKLTFRAGFDPQDEYLALEGIATIPHSHDDANCIMRLSWKDRLWIVEGDEFKSLRRYHNGVVAVRNGEHIASPRIAHLKAVGTLGDWGISQTLLPDDNGLDWERNIVWRKGEYFLVWDRLGAARDGDYSVECRWRTLGDVKVEGRVMRVVQDGETFSLTNADGSALSLSYRDALYAPDREDYQGYEHAQDGFQRILRQSQWRKMSAGERLQYVNLLEVTTGREASPISLQRENVANVGGPRKALVGLAEQGVTIGGLEVEARVFVVDSESVHVFGGTSIRWRGRSLWASQKPANTTVRVPGVETVLAVKAMPPKAMASPGLLATPTVVSPVWKVALRAAPSVMHVANGMVAVGEKNGAVERFDPSGARRGILAVASPISAVCLLPDGRMAFGARDGSLTLAGRAGEILWKKQFGHGIRQRLRVPSVLLLFDGDLLVGMEDESLFRFNLQGKEIWNTPCQHHAITQLGTVMIGDRPCIMVGLEYGTVNLLDSRGAITWSTSVGPAAALLSADIYGSGREEIVCANWEGVHVLRSSNGSLLWSANLGGETLGAVLVKESAERFDVCTASDSGQVARFQADGMTRWRLGTREPLTAMAVGAKTIALGCLSGAVQVRDLSSGRLLGTARMNSAIFKLCTLDPHRGQFIGTTEEGTLFALSVTA